jgi:dimethylglycine dehydrogenase
VGEEARAVRNGLGLFDISGYSKFRVSGRGAADWLDTLMANKVPAPGRTVLTPMLSPKGRLIGDFTLSRLAEDEFLILGSGPIQLYHLRWFLDHLPADGSVRVENLSADWCGLHLAGPRARECLATLTGEDVGGNAFPFLSARRMEVAGCPEAVVVRVSFTGELSYEIWSPMGYQLPMLERMLEAGRPFDVRLAGGRALMSLRLEKSFPSWGLELGPDYTPWDTSLGRFVRLDKGDFIGRAAARKAREKGGHERFATLIVDADKADASGGEAIYRNGTFAGYATSGGYGYTVGESLALGYLRPGMADPEASYEIEIIGERRPARLSPGPRFDPAGTRMRS